LGDASHCAWVKRLNQQGAHAADEHRRVGMNTVNGTVGGEPTLTGCIHDVRGFFVGVWPNDPVA
jgi:hypothetical protein